jgi:hypothetical protein
MIPSSQTFLEDPARLEPYLMGFELAELVTALSPRLAARDADLDADGEGPVHLREVLGEHLAGVLERGFRGVPADVVRRLLDRPELLLALQEVVFCEGGPHWEEVSRTVPHVGERRPPSLEQLEALLRGGREGEARSPIEDTVRPRTVVPLRPRRRWQWALRGAVAAAFVAVAGLALFLSTQVAHLNGLVQRLRSVEAVGQAAAYRQYYSNWVSAPERGYSYCVYYFKPNAADTEYQQHYCIAHPRRPNYVYYYNPATKAFWGRYLVSSGDRPHYSELAEKDRKGSLDQIPESAFPEPGAMPPIPRSTDGALMLPPPPLKLKDLATPDDLPAK